MKLERLGIVAIGEMYLVSIGIPAGGFDRRSLQLSTHITDAKLYSEKNARTYANKFGGHAIPITLQLEDRNE